MGNNENLRFEPQPVFSAILEGGQTFMDLGRRYGLDVKEFERLLRQKVGSKDFDRLQKASKKNWLKKRPKSKKPQAKGKTSKNEPVATRSQLLEQKENADRRIQELTLDVAKQKSKLDVATAKVVEAEAALRSAQKEKNVEENRLFRYMQKLEKWKKKSKDVEKMLKIIESQIYLVAPGYEGELPDAGKLISVIPFEGAEMQKGGELLNEPTAEDLLNSGYELISEARDAFNFARIVTKYMLEGIEVIVLVDDERVRKILEEQGLEL